MEALSRNTVVPPLSRKTPPLVRGDSKVSVLPPERTKFTPVPVMPPANTALAAMFVTSVPVFVVLLMDPPELGTTAALPVLKVLTYCVWPFRSRVPPFKASG